MVILRIIVLKNNMNPPSLPKAWSDGVYLIIQHTTIFLHLKRSAGTLPFDLVFFSSSFIFLGSPFISKSTSFISFLQMFCLKMII